MLIDVLMNNMMERISDPCCTVRMLAVRGLGNIAVGSPEKVKQSVTHERMRSLTADIFHEMLWMLLYHPPPLLTYFSHQVNKYAKELLAAMSSGMEEKDDPGNLPSRVLFYTRKRKVSVTCSLALTLCCFDFFLHYTHHVYSLTCSNSPPGLFHEQNCLSAGKLITLEAMSGLSKVLLYLDKKNVHLLVVYIFMKIKPFLESVCLFGSFLMLYDDAYCVL